MSLWTNRNWKLMLLKEVEKPFQSNDYLYEMKFDGIRACIFLGKEEFFIRSRNGKDLTYLYPELKKMRNLVSCNTILDGEILAMDEVGPSFSKLQERSHLKDDKKILFQAKNNPVVFIGFDILYQGHDLIQLPLEKRKEILHKLKDNEVFLKSKVYEDGISLFQNIQSFHLEGMVAKKRDSLYHIGTRSDEWVKIKNLVQEEFLIGGYEVKKSGYISVLLGEKKNGKLLYVGKASLTKTKKLYQDILKCSVSSKSPFSNYDSSSTFYIIPNMICLVSYLERTKNNQLRQPIIKERLE